MSAPSSALQARLIGLARSRKILDLAARFIAAPKGLSDAPHTIHLALLWGIGDAVTALPLVHAMKRKWPTARIILLGKSWLGELFAGEDVETRCLDAPWTAFSGKYRLWDRSWRRFAWQLLALRRDRADLWVNFRFDPRDVLLARGSGAHAIAGFGGAGARRWLSFDFSLEAVEFMRLYSGAVAAGLARTITGESCPDIPEFAGVRRMPRAIKSVVVAFGASHPIRRWKAAKIDAVVQGLRERGLLTTIIDESWAGDLQALKAAIADADLFIGADSGPLHIASALGVPTIGVFGPGSIERFAPRRSSDAVVAEPIDCRPCFDQCLYSSPLCLDRLSPTRILSIVDSLHSQ